MTRTRCPISFAGTEYWHCRTITLEPELADRMSKLREESHRLCSVWRLLSLMSSVVGVATVLALLVSVYPALALLVVVALVPGLVTAAGRQGGRAAALRHPVRTDRAISPAGDPGE